MGKKGKGGGLQAHILFEITVTEYALHSLKLILLFSVTTYSYIPIFWLKHQLKSLLLGVFWNSSLVVK